MYLYLYTPLENISQKTDRKWGGGGTTLTARHREKHPFFFCVFKTRRQKIFNSSPCTPGPSPAGAMGDGGGGVNPYGQPDRKIPVFFLRLPKQSGKDN